MKKVKRASQKALINRYKVISGIMLLFAILIAGKLMKTTVVDASKWNKLAETLVTDSVVMYPERGNIFASDGSVLAANVRFYELKIDFGANGFKEDTLKRYIKPLCDSICTIKGSGNPEKMQAEILECLKNYKDLKELDKTLPDSLKKSKKYRHFQFMQKCSNIDLARVCKLKFFTTNGGKGTLAKNPKTQRIRPFGSMASQSIGSVKEERSSDNSLIVHGATGLERALDSLLFGKPGLGSSIQLTNGIRQWAEIKPQRGYDVVTTIDIRIQDILENELRNKCIETNAEWGTAVLMEVSTGEIKAISNLRLDPASGKYFEGINYAFRGYEPGSVMKPISMLIALEDNLVGINEKIPTGKSFSYAHGRPISDPHAYSSLTPGEIITVSSNIGMSKIIIRGFEKEPWKFKERLKNIGFLDNLNLGIYGERPPEIPDLGDKNWDRISLTRICYGYTTKIPPIYTLSIYNAIANGGKFIRPRLVKELWKDGVCDTVFGTSYVREQICSPEVAAEVSDMLKSVVWDKHGTARALQNNFVSISGKTGTAYDIVDGKYDTSKKRLAFCGFFPSDKPKYSCIVLMSRANRGAAYSSGMVLMNTALKLYARGLLDNVSDYRAETDNRNTPATFYAIDKATTEDLKAELGLPGVRHFKERQAAEKGHVPSVVGMGLRQALQTLEGAGLNVSGFSGRGYVCQQSLKPGEKFKKGDKITLQLK